MDLSDDAKPATTLPPTTEPKPTVTNESESPKATTLNPVTETKETKPAATETPTPTPIPTTLPPPTTVGDITVDSANEILWQIKAQNLLKKCNPIQKKFIETKMDAINETMQKLADPKHEESLLLLLTKLASNVEKLKAMLATIPKGY